MRTDMIVSVSGRWKIKVLSGQLALRFCPSDGFGITSVATSLHTKVERTL